MPVSLSNSLDIIANSVSIIQDNRLVNILDLISQITGLAPETLNTLQELAASINNDQTFHNTINTQLAAKANSADVYTRSETYTQSQINTALSGKQNSISLTSTIALQQLNAMGTVSCSKLVSENMETPTATIKFRVSTSTEVARLTAALISLKSPVLIEQGCKIQNELSVGSYSLITPTLWVETASFSNGNFYSSNTITAGGNINATNGSVSCNTLLVNATSTFTGTVTANEIKPSTITHNDVTGTGKLIIKAGDTLEFHNSANFPLLEVSSLANRGCSLRCNLLMHNWDITGGRDISCGRHLVGGGNVVATDELKGRTLKITTTSVFDGNITAPNIYTKEEVNGLLSGYATTSSVSALQQISSTTALSLASITLTGSLTCAKVIAPVLESNGASLSFKINPTTEVLSLSDSGSFFNNTIKTNRSDETLLFLAGKYKFYDKYSTEIFGHDSTNNYMLHHLDMRGKSIHNATNLSALTHVYTPTVRTRNIEFWDVDTSGSTNLNIISGADTFMSFSTISTNVKINVFKPILSVEDIQAGSITTISGNISSTAGNIQTRDGTVGGARGTFNQLYVSGVKDVTAPSSRGLYLGLDSNNDGGIDICADTNQYIDFTTLSNNYRGRLIYNNTNNDFKMHVNGSTTPSLTLNSTTLSTNVIACTGIGKPVAPTAAGVYIGLDSSTGGGIEICTGSAQYIDFTIPTPINPPPTYDFRGRMLYNHSESAFAWSVGGSGTAKMVLNATALYVGGTTVSSSDKRLKFNEKPLTNALDLINRLDPVEYDQTRELTESYTADTPQTHQCGFIAQSVQQIDELKYAVVGGEIGEDGVESIRYLNYNVIFTHAVKAIQELSQLVKQQQEQIDAQKQQIEKLINVILNA